MQSRKELADAGRRKLEEFRKAKAQGKTPAPTASVKTNEGPNAATPSPVPVSNGDGLAHLPLAPESSSAVPKQPSSPQPQAPSGGFPPLAPPPAEAAVAVVNVAPQHFGAPPPPGRLPLYPAPPPQPVAQPPPVASSAEPAPVTTFVVLQDAPIPFGSSPTPTAPAPRVSSNGLGAAPQTSSAVPFGGYGVPAPPASLPTHGPDPHTSSWFGRSAGADGVATHLSTHGTQEQGGRDVPFWEQQGQRDHQPPSGTALPNAGLYDRAPQPYAPGAASHPHPPASSSHAAHLSAQIGADPATTAHVDHAGYSTTAHLVEPPSARGAPQASSSHSLGSPAGYDILHGNGQHGLQPTNNEVATSITTTEVSSAITHNVVGSAAESLPGLDGGAGHGFGLPLHRAEQSVEVSAAGPAAAVPAPAAASSWMSAGGPAALAEATGPALAGLFGSPPASGSTPWMTYRQEEASSVLPGPAAWGLVGLVGPAHPPLPAGVQGTFLAPATEAAAPAVHAPPLVHDSAVPQLSAHTAPEVTALRPYPPDVVPKAPAVSSSSAAACGQAGGHEREAPAGGVPAARDDGVSVAAGTSGAATPSGVPPVGTKSEALDGYGQLADSYLAEKSRTTTGAEAEAAASGPSGAGEVAAVGGLSGYNAPDRAEPGSVPSRGVDEEAASASPPPPLPVSFSAASPAAPGGTSAYGSWGEAPQPAGTDPVPPPNPAPALAPESAPVPLPAARSAYPEPETQPAPPQQPQQASRPSTSRFAWLFGSPPPAKREPPQPQPQQQQPAHAPEPPAPAPKPHLPASPPYQPEAPAAPAAELPAPPQPEQRPLPELSVAAPHEPSPLEPSPLPSPPAPLPYADNSASAGSSAAFSSYHEQRPAFSSWMDSRPAPAAADPGSAVTPAAADGADPTLSQQRSGQYSLGQGAISSVPTLGPVSLPWPQPAAAADPDPAPNMPPGSTPTWDSNPTASIAAPPLPTAAAASAASVSGGQEGASWEGYGAMGPAAAGAGFGAASFPPPATSAPSTAAAPGPGPSWLGGTGLGLPEDRYTATSSSSYFPAVGAYGASGFGSEAPQPSFLRPQPLQGEPAAPWASEPSAAAASAPGLAPGPPSHASSHSVLQEPLAGAPQESVAAPVSQGRMPYPFAADTPASTSTSTSASAPNLLAQAAPAPPRPPIPPNSSASNFAATASYLSAYSSSSNAVPTASGAAAATTSTASFLDSYLDNLLSSMSASKDAGVDSAKGAAGGEGAASVTAGGGAGTASHTGDRSQGLGRSGAATPRSSYPGEGMEAAAGGAGGVALTPRPGGGGGGHHDESVPEDVSVTAAVEAGRGGLMGHGDGSAHGPRGHLSRRPSMDSAGMLSVQSHGTGFANALGNMHGPSGGGFSGGSRAQFAALQQHIDELTEEKLALSRGLQQQVRINEQLAEENEELTRQYNARGAAVEELERKIKQYEQELEAQALSLEGFSEERQAARTSYVEASSRAQALASEVVSLEAQVLQLKSAVLKAERAAEEAQQRARKLEKQVETLTKEAKERSQELQQVQAKGRNLVVMLKQTEGKLHAAEEKLAQQTALGAHVHGLHPHGSASGLLPNGQHAAAAAPPAPPPKPPCVEQEVQCELAAELAAAEAAEAAAAAAAAAEAEAEAAAAAAAEQEAARRLARSLSGSAGSDAGKGLDSSDGHPANGQLAVVPETGHRPDADVPGTPNRALPMVDWAAARPHRDAPSAVVAERALGSLDSSALRRVLGKGPGEGLPEGLDAVAVQLARWLPAGPISGGDPVAVMVEEELRLMQSIHELLGNCEQAQEAAAAQVQQLQAQLAGLAHENDELRHKLELQTQRLELQMQGRPATGPPVSLHQTPVPSVPEMAEETAAMGTPTIAPKTAQPQPRASLVGATQEAVVTPTKGPAHYVQHPHMDSTMFPSTEGSLAATPSRQSWMGYLFRPRQKKRIRSAIL